jgi:hypothetical protein
LLGRPHWESVSGHGAEKKAFREVGSLIWPLAFCPDQRDLAVETCIAQTGGDGIAGRSAPDDYCYRRSLKGSPRTHGDASEFVGFSKAHKRRSDQTR